MQKYFTEVALPKKQRYAIIVVDASKDDHCHICNCDLGLAQILNPCTICGNQTCDDCLNVRYSDEFLRRLSWHTKWLCERCNLLTPALQEKIRDVRTAMQDEEILEYKQK